VFALGSVLLGLAFAQTPPSQGQVDRYDGLFSAVAAGDVAGVEELVAGADLEARDDSGRTPLLVTAHFSHDGVARALLKAGADPNVLDVQAYDLITIAAVKNDVDMILLGLEFGADPGAVTSPYDGTALIAAAHLGHAETVQTLIAAGAPLDHVNNLGWTALIEAVILGDGGARHTAVLRALLKAGADPSLSDRNGETPLRLATEYGYLEMARALEPRPSRIATVSRLLLQNVRPLGKDPVDVLIEDGVISRLEPAITLPEPSADPNLEIFDGDGRLLLPGLVNAHAHLDKNLLGLRWHENQVPGSRIRDFVDFEREFRKTNDLSAETQSARQVEASVALGITHIRSHVDVDTEAGLKHFEGMLATQEKYRDVVTVQLVAFPQSGMLIRPGTLPLLEEAAQMGAACLGGLDPSTVDRNPVEHLDALFALAERCGTELDIHLHEPGELGAFAVELVAERTRATGMQGKVTLSHCFCLGMVDEAYLGRLTDLLLENRIAVMSLGSGGSPFPPLKKLYEAGVLLCTGTDGVRDTWGPYNGVDVLERVKLLGYLSGLRKDKDIEMLLDVATYGGAKVMKDEGYGLEVGRRADLVVLPGDTPAHAVVESPARSLVLKNGRVVARGGKLEPLV